jgi:hypothetical protein
MVASNACVQTEKNISAEMYSSTHWRTALKAGVHENEFTGFS